MRAVTDTTARISTNPRGPIFLSLGGNRMAEVKGPHERELGPRHLGKRVSNHGERGLRGPVGGWRGPGCP